MPEYYTLTPDGCRLTFTKRNEEVPPFALSAVFEPQKAPKNLTVVCRMGSQDAMHCIIFRTDDKPGGLFALHDSAGFLFAAQAESELAYALAKGFFGSLAERAHTGIDIFENPGDTDA